MATNQPAAEPAPRRIILRRRMGGGGGGFSASTSTVSTTLRETAAEPDEVDDAIEPTNINHRVRTGAVAAPQPPAAPAPRAPADRDNPRLRLNQVALAGSANYAKEYRLVLLNRLLMRNIPLDQIAQTLQVSISTVEKDRAELKKRLREAATELNINEIVGGQNAFYDEVAGMAMRVASTGATRDENGNEVQAVPTAMRLAAMRTALAANADRNRFMNTAGVYDVLRFRRAEDGADISDVQQLMMRTAEMMEQFMGEQAPDQAPPAPRGGGFGPMTFDDENASSADREVQEI